MNKFEIGNDKGRTMEDRTRRHFVKTSALGTMGLSLAGILPGSGPLYEGEKISSQTLSDMQIGNTFINFGFHIRFDFSNYAVGQ